MKQHGVTKETVKRFLVDAGAVFVNYGETDERKLGATRGGNSFTVEQEVREMEIDGVKGKVKGARRVISVSAAIVANLIEMTAENFKLALAGLDSTDYPDTAAKTHDSLRRNREIADSDYLKNIALVGNISGTDTPIILMIYNALADGNLELSTEDKNEAGLEVTFSAHFDPADLEVGDDTEPYEIRFPIETP